jgi:DNA polymerase-3 subunit delta'
VVILNEVNNLKYIENSFYENKLSHAFLIETNNFEKCLTDIKSIIKIINCEREYDNNCTKCNLCYQIEKETLPNFIIIRPDGASIKKEQVIDLKEKMLTKPIYSKYNTYVILNSEKLNNFSANTMLKFIEEPEENIIGFFITNNKENIIETIKSRCQLIYQHYDQVEEILDEEKQQLVEDYIKNIELDNKYALLYNKNIFLEKNLTREEIIKIFLEIFRIYDNIYRKENEKLIEKYNFLASQDNLKLSSKLRIINNTIDNLSKNGNINLILDSFVIEMR